MDSTQAHEVLPEKFDPERIRRLLIDVPSVSVGTMRTSAGWIIIMLAAEEPAQRPQIILDVMQHLGIEIRDLQATADDRPCPSCGISLLEHKDGKCF
jgi:hypothetical protein